MRYCTRSKFFWSLALKKNLGLILQAVFKLGSSYVKGSRIPLLSLSELGEKSQVTIILGKFVNKP